MHNEDEKFLAKENILFTDSYCKNDTSVFEEAGPVKETKQASNLTAVTPRPHKWAHSPLIPLPNWKMMSDTSMLPLTIKQS
jgi:hypothetical protein